MSQTEEPADKIRKMESSNESRPACPTASELFFARLDQVLPARSRSFIEIKTLEDLKKYYVDRSTFIRTVASLTQPLFISAPSRFGKTCIVSMLENFFQLEVFAENPTQMKTYESTVNYQLFKDQEICAKNNLGFLEKHMAKYAVFKISLADVQVIDRNSLLLSLVVALRKSFKPFRFTLPPKGEDLELDSLIRGVFDKKIAEANDACILAGGEVLTRHLKNYFNRKCIVLVDEYDMLACKLINKCIYNDDKSFLEEMRDTYGIFIKNLARIDECVAYSYLTGRTKYSHYISDSITLKHVPFLKSKQIGRSIGLSLEDVDKLINKVVVDVSKRPHLKEQLSLYYNGYVAGKGEEKIKLFQTNSVIQSLMTKSTEVFWKAGQEEDFLSKMFTPGFSIGDELLRVLLGSKTGISVDDKILKKSNAERLPLDDMIQLGQCLNFFSKGISTMDEKTLIVIENCSSLCKQYLLELGYFVVVENNNITELQIPNMELKVKLTSYISQNAQSMWLLSQNSLQELVTSIQNLKNSDSESECLLNFVNNLQTFFRPVLAQLTKEVSLESILFANLLNKFSVVKQQMRSPSQTIMDVYIEDDNMGLIMEIKIKKSGRRNHDAIDALKQIFSRGYFHSIDKFDHRIFLGISFDCATRKFAACLQKNSTSLNGVKSACATFQGLCDVYP